MSNKRIIKKYPNRRLYDTEISSYIVLKDVKKLVLEGNDFQVLDVKSGEDLTCNILLQIISDQEYNGVPLFSSDTLTQFIRFYGDSMQGVFSEYLSRSLSLFMQQQQQLRSQIDKITPPPFNMFAELTESNMDLWKRMQENFFHSAGGSAKQAEEAPPADSVANPSSETKPK